MRTCRVRAVDLSGGRVVRVRDVRVAQSGSSAVVEAARLGSPGILKRSRGVWVGWSAIARLEPLLIGRPDPGSLDALRALPVEHLARMMSQLKRDEQGLLTRLLDAPEEKA